MNEGILSKFERYRKEEKAYIEKVKRELNKRFLGETILAEFNMVEGHLELIIHRPGCVGFPLEDVKIITDVLDLQEGYDVLIKTENGMKIIFKA